MHVLYDRREGPHGVLSSPLYRVLRASLSLTGLGPSIVVRMAELCGMLFLLVVVPEAEQLSRH